MYIVSVAFLFKQENVSNITLEYKTTSFKVITTISIVCLPTKSTSLHYIAIDMKRMEEHAHKKLHKVVIRYQDYLLTFFVIQLSPL